MGESLDSRLSIDFHGQMFKLKNGSDYYVRYHGELMILHGHFSLSHEKIRLNSVVDQIESLRYWSLANDSRIATVSSGVSPGLMKRGPANEISRKPHLRPEYG